MKNRLLPFVLMCTLFLNADLIAQEVLQLTDNDYSDSNPQISYDHIVWLGNAGPQGSEVFHFDLETQTAPTALTADEQSKGLLRISGNNLVWVILEEQDDFNTFEVVYYDLEGEGSPVQLTDNAIGDFDPAISGNHVVWFGKDIDDNSAGTQLYHMDLALLGQSEPELLLDNGKTYYFPAISGNHVAWYYADGSDSEVVYYNLETQGAPLQLTNTNVFVNGIQCSANKLWWYGWHNDIHYLDFNGTGGAVQLYDVDPNGYRINLHASDDYAVWSRWNGQQRDIFYYDLASNGPIQLTADTTLDDNPIVSGGYVFWERGTGDETEIFYYDLINQGPIVQLTDNDFKDAGIKASGARFVWQGGYEDQPESNEIFATELPNLTTSTENPAQLNATALKITPNPTIDESILEFTLAERSDISLQLLDINGKLLSTLGDQTMSAGTHQISIDVHTLPAGVYLCALRSEDFLSVQRLVVGQ